MKYIKVPIALILTLIFTVLYIGMIVCAILAVIAGVIRTLGFTEVSMAYVPVALSVPFGIVLSGLFIWFAYLSKKVLRWCKAQFFWQTSLTD
ncbi:hypothetical protein GCM10007425_05600 [Lysinibacillus alkalisoli]|uniref:Uncharacterized protein n=1 Tax=Lysinibacillus alkalisoli TaxID=1911548 RepID=A0A917LDL8_9BACI|nr:hypothetical protein [Lysinibacillus alkalisoli]GGG14201.1 hypothetical protein GCM10007425_05600 [Lysinibacillus alkalisoli]